MLKHITRRSGVASFQGAEDQETNIMSQSEVLFFNYFFYFQTDYNRL